jgi:hypothetical protein
MASSSPVATVVVGGMALAFSARSSICLESFPPRSQTADLLPLGIKTRHSVAFASSGYAYDRDVSLVVALSGTPSVPWPGP